MAYSDQLPYIAFHTGGDVIDESVLGRNASVSKREVAALKQGGVQVAGRMTCRQQLRCAQGAAFNPTHPACQRLCDPREQVKLSRAREYKVAHDAALVHPALWPRQPFRAALHLVQNRAAGKALQKAFGVTLCELLLVRFFSDTQGLSLKTDLAKVVLPD